MKKKRHCIQCIHIIVCANSRLQVEQSPFVWIQDRATHNHVQKYDHRIKIEVHCTCMYNIPQLILSNPDHHPFHLSYSEEQKVEELREFFSLVQPRVNNREYTTTSYTKWASLVLTYCGCVVNKLCHKHTHNNKCVLLCSWAANITRLPHTLYQCLHNVSP